MNNRSAIIIPTLAFAKYLKTIGYNRRPIPSGDPIGGNERAAAVCGSRKLAAHIQITDVGPNCVWSLVRNVFSRHRPVRCGVYGNTQRDRLHSSDSSIVQGQSCFWLWLKGG